jgi:hypothetical protein
MRTSWKIAKFDVYCACACRYHLDNRTGVVKTPHFFIQFESLLSWLRVFVYSPQFTHQALRLIHTSLHNASLANEPCPGNHGVPTITSSWFVTSHPGIRGYLVAMVTTELGLRVTSQPGFRWRPGFLRYNRASPARGITPRIRLGSWFPCLRQSFVGERRYKTD